MTDSYLNMLNNPTINPPTQNTSRENNQESRLKPANFAQEAKELLTVASKDVYLTSESDEPFEFINTLTEKDRLPETIEELEELGLLNGEEERKMRIKSVPEFLRQEEYKDIVEALDRLDKGKEQKVYLVGEISITVLLLTIIKKDKEYAIVGLKSLLVQS